MGVPGFFAWLRRKYPQIVDDSAGAAGDDGEGNACDNLYVGKDPLLYKRALFSRRHGNHTLSKACLRYTALLDQCLDRTTIDMYGSFCRICITSAAAEHISLICLSIYPSLLRQ